MSSKVYRFDHERNFVPLPRCPYCGEETDTVYMNRDGALLGCDNCVSTADAWDELSDPREREF